MGISCPVPVPGSGQPAGACFSYAPILAQSRAYCKIGTAGEEATGPDPRSHFVPCRLPPIRPPRRIRVCTWAMSNRALNVWWFTRAGITALPNRYPACDGGVCSKNRMWPSCLQHLWYHYSTPFGQTCDIVLGWQACGPSRTGPRGQTRATVALRRDHGTRPRSKTLVSGAAIGPVKRWSSSNHGGISWIC